jgi:drug/metabolite transporter (DMT)-like permease
VLGTILAVLSGASFALNNAAARRAVLTGTPTQGMALTVPIGVLCFLPVAVLTGQFARLGQFPLSATAWMAGVGMLHFLFGRYCNYRANQRAGTNLTGPVIQMQVVVTLALAVIVLNEPCSVLQVAGGIVMLAGSLITQRQAAPTTNAAVAGTKETGPQSASAAAAGPSFVPRYAEGFLFASLAALAYGTTPIMVRTALRQAGPSSAIVGGLIAYGAATAAVAALLLVAAPLRRNVMSIKRENIRWFVYSGMLVALAQGFFYSAVAVAPIMLVMPVLQSALVFRLIFARWLNPTHEVFGAQVIIGAAISIIGACTVSVDTNTILEALGVPETLGHLLRWQV